MEASVEFRVESIAQPEAGRPSLRLRLFGSLAVERDGTPLPLPPSRKVRALIAYLALAGRAVPRSRLCELLWDLPNDPRGELRWCLSKARAVLDSPGRPRVITEGESVRLDLADTGVDALDMLEADLTTLRAAGPDGLRQLAAQHGGDLLQDLAIERSAPFSAWLTAQRRRFRERRAALLEALADSLPPGSDEALATLEEWLQLAPFELRAHARLFDALARRGRLREGDEHLAATARQFEAEGQDWAPVGIAWRAAKGRRAATAPQPLLQPATPAPAPEAAPGPTRRASIAVMPFADHSREPGARGGLADGLAHDVITRLAKLRSLFVIAQGTMFALDARQLGAEEAGRALDVDYLASGSLRRADGQVSVTVQLTDARGARLVWADTFSSPLQDTFAVLDEIGNRIVASLAQQIEVSERNRAVLKAPNSLDAWEAHHRGLWHMVRFNREDNVQAHRFFSTAVQLDPTFARPYAGLSFTHFQNAFLGWGDRTQEIELAYRIAAQGLLADDRDPAAHWAMGRALWLRGQLDASLGELQTSVALSPNYALGHYTLAFVEAQSGDPRAAIRAADHSRDLSPFDPLLFAMLATRALALMRLGRHDEAADWAVRAAARPNAHAHILGIAAHCLALADRLGEARQMAGALQRAQPGYGLDEFLASFRFGDDATGLLRQAAGRIGIA
ncbi:MAG: transcriptional regulator [Piscinibacter sp.]|nr:transcriptional regulator [Piscinibacter sp.]